MQDPEFEKEVREKMSELKFSPSESVWTSVQMQIAKDKRRRPLFWIFLLGGIMLAGGGTYFFMNRYNSVSPVESTPVEAVETSTDSSPVLPVEDKNAQEKNGKKSGKRILSIQKPSTSSTFTSSIGKNKTNARVSKPGYKANDNSDDAIGKSDPKIEKQNVEPSTNSKISENNSISEPVIAVNNPPSEKHAMNGKSINPDSVSSVMSKSTEMTDSSVSVSKPDLKKGDPKKLHIGFTTSAGMSDVFSSEVTTQTVYAAYALYANPSLAAAAPGLSHSPSAIQPGFSFSAGLIAEQKISKKFLLSVGLNYHYYSSSMETGSKSDNLSSNSVQVYTWGNSNQYTNKYHFVELPFSLSYEVNNSKKLPMFVEAGLTISQWLGGNTLQYDYLSGVYFESKNNISKTQLLGSAAYLFGLNQKGLSLKIGPQIQYGFNNLAGGSAVAKEHLFFAGIKFILLPKK